MFIAEVWESRSWDTFLFAVLAATESQEAGFQRLQGTFRCVGNESTTNVPWQAALKEGEWKVHLVTNTILICITEAPSTVNSCDNTINTNTYTLVLWQVFWPETVRYFPSFSCQSQRWFFLFFSLSPSSYLRKWTFPCMKAIITVTPFGVSALCRRGRRVAASNIQLIITSGIMSKMKEIGAGLSQRLSCFLSNGYRRHFFRVSVTSRLFKVGMKSMHAICFNGEWMKWQKTKLTIFPRTTCFPGRFKYYFTVLSASLKVKHIPKENGLVCVSVLVVIETICSIKTTVIVLIVC